MPQIQANGIRLEYEVIGQPGGRPVLLIMGLGAQMTRWPERFYRPIIDAGSCAVRYDNRDIGRSTWFDDAGPPRVVAATARALMGLSVPSPYLLGDMAKDAVGLLDGLGLPSAHVIGVSMGGMIAQILAAEHPGRVRSLVSIMSSSGSRKLPPPHWRLRVALARRPPRGASRDTRIEWTVQVMKAIASPGFPLDEKMIRNQVASEIDRAYHPRGLGRQLVAIIASGSRGRLLGKITAPTLILHGAEDPLIPVAAAHDLHKRIPSAELEVFPGMGHDLPAALMPQMTGRIIEHHRRADELWAQRQPRARN